MAKHIYEDGRNEFSPIFWICHFVPLHQGSCYKKVRKSKGTK
jgi:hypothetical protein